MNKQKLKLSDYYWKMFLLNIIAGLIFWGANAAENDPVMLGAVIAQFIMIFLMSLSLYQDIRDILRKPK